MTPSAVAVEDRLYRALTVIRVVVTLNMVGLNLYRAANYERPLAALGLVVLLVAWTGVAIWAYSSHRRRTPLLLGVDLAFALAGVLATPLLKGPGFNATVAGFWVMGALLAWAIHWHVIGGLIAASLLSVSDLALRQSIDQANYGNVFLLMIGGPVVGYMCKSLQRMAAERDRAEREAAAATERTRLARAVHDGTLQVLALVQREGAASGDPRWSELGRLAGEQERSLRTLIRQQDTIEVSGCDQTDLIAALERMVEAHVVRVEVSTGGRAVLLPGGVVDELVAAVRAALDNVALHTPGASAWLLLESDSALVTVSIRDDGPGIPEGRLAAAEAEGRLGVSESICGRLRDLGGEARVDTGSWGTEWELEAPRT